MYDLEQLSLRAMTECGAALRTLHLHASSLDDVCTRMVRYLYGNLGAADGPACVLVRAYMTHDVADLTPELREMASAVAGRELDAATKCLTLMASVGDEPEWNSPATSRGHRVLPLESGGAVERMPMVAQLVKQLGLDTATIVAPDDQLIVDLQQQTFNVFHVEEAKGSASIPAQDFVERYGVRSVLGFGTMLPTGDLFSVILFSRVRIRRPQAELFRPLAVAAKLSILPFLHDQRLTVQAHV